MPCYRHPRPAIAVGPIGHILKGSTTPRERSPADRMIEKRPYLQELDEAISRGTHATRLQALWHATDLLIGGSPRNHGLTLRAHHPHDLLGVACTAYEPSLWASATAFLAIPPLQRARHRICWPQENHIADGVFTQLGSQKYMPSVPRSQIVLISPALARFAAQRPKLKLATACVWSAEGPRTRRGLSEVRFETGSKISNRFEPGRRICS